MKISVSTIIGIEMHVGSNFVTMWYISLDGLGFIAILACGRTVASFSFPEKLNSFGHYAIFFATLPRIL